MLALVGKDLLGVGYGNAHRCRLGKQQAADARGVIGREAMVAAAKGLGGNGKGPLGCLGAHGVWHQVDGAKGNDDHGKPRTRKHGGRDVTLRDAPRYKKQQECRHGCHHSWELPFAGEPVLRSSRWRYRLFQTDEAMLGQIVANER